MSENKEVKVACPNCDGDGQKIVSRGNHSSLIRLRTCYTCMGTGEVTPQEFHNFKNAVKEKLKELELGKK